mgnify:FL=1
MALLFVVTAIAGFAPTSIGLIKGVTSGQLSFPPFILHFHAASLSLWLLLLLAQTLLMYTARPKLHKTLGLASFVIAPCLLISMYGVEVMNIGNNVLMRNGTAPAQDTEFMRNISTSLLVHTVSYVFFPLFYLRAIMTRKKDGETHKRMMILATLVLMIPGLGRLLSVTQVIPDFGLSVIDARHFYMLLLIVPALAYDIVKDGRPHRAYMMGLGLLGIWIVIAHFLWGSVWWMQSSPKLLGV